MSRGGSTIDLYFNRLTRNVRDKAMSHKGFTEKNNLYFICFPEINVLYRVVFHLYDLNPLYNLIEKKISEMMYGFDIVFLTKRKMETHR